MQVTGTEQWAIGLRVINLLGTMKIEHLNVSCVFRQALSEGLFICVVRRIRGILERGAFVSMDVHQLH